ncbi:uncharacterized protein TNCV_476711 [Trichonephila clavipes]|nr:uncharacterized protein TNCV_476711 [Trichonephila clavipes]
MARRNHLEDVTRGRMIGKKKTGVAIGQRRYHSNGLASALTWFKFHRTLAGCFRKTPCGMITSSGKTPKTLKHMLIEEWALLAQELLDSLVLSIEGWYEATIADEVEKLAYQLNEEAERTERPIRRLSKVMYSSTCADMQVDVMGECLSSIKHVVGVRSVFLAKRLHAV